MQRPSRSGHRAVNGVVVDDDLSHARGAHRFQATEPRVVRSYAAAVDEGQRPTAAVAPDGQVDAVELCLAGRMESDTVRLTYRGGVWGVRMLAQMLEEQGVSVQYTPPR